MASGVFPLIKVFCNLSFLQIDIPPLYAVYISILHVWGGAGEKRSSLKALFLPLALQSWTLLPDRGERARGLPTSQVLRNACRGDRGPRATLKFVGCEGVSTSGRLRYIEICFLFSCTKFDVNHHEMKSSMDWWWSLNYSCTFIHVRSRYLKFRCKTILPSDFSPKKIHHNEI